MACFIPGTGTLAVIAFSVFLLWHRAIGHFLAIMGVVAGPVLVAGAAAAAAGLVIWTARVIRRRRARAGACTTCRFGCQQSLSHRSHLLVRRVDRRPAAPAGGPGPAVRPGPGPARRPVPVPAPSHVSAPGRARWPTAGESVAFGGYVLTPDGVGHAAVPVQASESTRANAST